MKLLLTSEGFSNESIKQALAGLVERPFNELNLAFIPTAANVEEGDKGWLIDNYQQCRDLGFKMVDIVEISGVSRNVWEKRLKAADVIMVGGGNTFHLNYWLQKSGLKEALSALLMNRVYVGVSAGSMITSPNLVLSSSSKLYYEDAGEMQAFDQGLNFVPFHVRPHLNNPYFPKVNREYLTEISRGIKEKIYAIDDNTAVMVNDQEVKVISEGEWFVIENGKP